jgi:hypothetical protein
MHFLDSPLRVIKQVTPTAGLVGFWKTKPLAIVSDIDAAAST